MAHGCRTRTSGGHPKSSARGEGSAGRALSGKGGSMRRKHAKAAFNATARGFAKDPPC